MQIVSLSFRADFQCGCVTVMVKLLHPHGPTNVKDWKIKISSQQSNNTLNLTHETLTRVVMLLSFCRALKSQRQLFCFFILDFSAGPDLLTQINIQADKAKKVHKSAESSRKKEHSEFAFIIGRNLARAFSDANDLKYNIQYHNIKLFFMYQNQSWRLRPLLTFSNIIETTKNLNTWLPGFTSAWTLQLAEQHRREEKFPQHLNKSHCDSPSDPGRQY